MWRELLFRLGLSPQGEITVEQMRRRFLSVCLWGGSAFVLALSVAAPHPALTLVFYLVCSATYAVLAACAQFTRTSATGLTHAMLTMAWWQVGWVILHTGGAHSPKMMWLVLLMVLALALLPVRHALLWLVALLLQGLAQISASQHGWVDLTVAQTNTALVWAWLNHLLVIVGLGVVLYHYQGVQQCWQNHQQAAVRDIEATSRGLERARQYREEFMAAVGHELRTPMNAILGLNEVLHTQLAHQPQDAELVGLIRGSAEQLLRVVNNLLDYSQLQAGRMRLMPAPMALAPWLQHCAAQSQAMAAPGVQVHTDLVAAQGAWVMADRQRLGQMVMALLERAVRVTSDGAVQVRVRRIAHEWRIDVLDGGPALTPGELAALFQPFDAMAPSTQRPHGDTGLSLALCEQLVRLHGGRVGAEARGAPQGSCLWLALPLAEAPAPLATAPGAPAQADAATGALPLPPLTRALIVDDNALNRLVAQLLLQKGWPQAQLDQAETAAEAQTRLMQQPYDLVLMDVRMPDMDGLALTRWLRAGVGPNAATPVLAMTALNAPQDQEACLQAGMNAMVFKPLQAEPCQAAIAQALAASPGGRHATA